MTATADLITRRPMTDAEFAARWARERKAWAPATAACQGCGREHPLVSLANVETEEFGLELLCQRCVAESSDQRAEAAHDRHLDELIAANPYM